MINFSYLDPMPKKGQEQKLACKASINIRIEIVISLTKLVEILLILLNKSEQIMKPLSEHWDQTSIQNTNNKKMTITIIITRLAICKQYFET